MCGLAGLARLDGTPLSADADPILRRMATTIGHRGPDGREFLRDREVGLAFTRLSLVAPEDGTQPLVSADGSLALIVNGEIYNHRELAPPEVLRTGSDCEALLHLYAERGSRFLEQVRGMFALVLWDRRANKLVLARDRFGIKPMYFHRNAQRIVFASEIKALFADPHTPREFDWEAAIAHPMVSCATIMAPFEPTTWFRDVHSVPAATIVEIDLATGATKQSAYWQFPEAGSGPAMPDADYIEQYAALLAESVAECATADAELGLFLSGGVDSASVAALAVGHAPQLHTFTALSGSTLRNGDAENGRRVANYLGLPNHQVVFDAARVPSAEEWKRLLWLTETPLCGAEQFYKHELHRYAKLARPELRGMLLGAASDEFNGGYAAMIGGGGTWQSFTSALRSMVRDGVLLGRPEIAPWWRHVDETLFTDDFVSRMTGTAVADDYQVYLRREYDQVLQYNCWHEDRTAAASGIEARVPFLDHRLVELVVGVPAEQRESLLWDKRILRDGVRALLPPEIAEREKVPFYYGDGEQHTFRWLAGMLGQRGGVLVEEALSAPGAREYLDADGISQLVGRVVERHGGQESELVLRVVNIGLLAAMASDIPKPIVQRPLEIAPVAMEIGDWTSEQTAIAARLCGSDEVSEQVVLDFADGVMLLQHAHSEDCYIVVDGSLEFVVDDEFATWRRFLRQVDGQRSIGTLLGDAECTIDDIRDLMVDAMSERVLVQVQSVAVSGP